MNGTVITHEHKTHETAGQIWHEHFIRLQLPNGAEGTIDYIDHPGSTVPRYWATYRPAWMHGSGWWECRTDDWREAKRYALTAYAGVWEEDSDATAETDAPPAPVPMAQAPADPPMAQPASDPIPSQPTLFDGTLTEDAAHLLAHGQISRPLATELALAQLDANRQHVVMCDLAAGRITTVKALRTRCKALALAQATEGQQGFAWGA